MLRKKTKTAEEKNELEVLQEKPAKSTQNHDRKNSVSFVLRYVLIFVVAIILSFLAGVKFAGRDPFNFLPNAVSQIKVANQLNEANKSVDFGMFWQVWNKLNENYYDKSKVDPQKMLQGAISGMVKAIGDPYTTYLSIDDNKAINEELDGSFEGVGMQLGYNDQQQLVVMSPLEKSPALRAGIKAKDRILAIDGKDTTDETLNDAVGKIRGKAGTSVKLTILREKENKPFEVELTREKITVPSVTSSIKDGYAVIKINRFGEQTNTEWDTAVQDAVAKQVKGVIVDVRNNPGGYLNDAIYIGSDFVTGTVVSQEGLTGKKDFKSTHAGRLLKLPVVVLMNGGSASASEILAGAIKVSDNGKLVGVKSFGKGTVQDVENFQDGAGLHVTIAKWLLPNGDWIHGKGLMPDVEVDMTADDVKNGVDPQLDKALETIKGMVK